MALGGVAFTGGRGGLLGAAAGGALLFLIENLFSLAQVSIYYIQIAYGSILLVALALNSVIDRDPPPQGRRRLGLADLGKTEERMHAGVPAKPAVKVEAAVDIFLQRIVVVQGRNFATDAVHRNTARMQ